jgi:hypothetical protein
VKIVWLLLWRLNAGWGILISCLIRTRSINDTSTTPSQINRESATSFMSSDEIAHTTEVVPSPTLNSSHGQVSMRTVAFVLTSIALAVVCVALALEYFVAERLPELTEEKLRAAMTLWQKAGPASYDMDIELRGVRPGQVHVEVRNKEVELETRDGRTPGRWTWDTWSVPGLFDTLSQDLDIAQDPEQQIQAAPGTTWRPRCEFDPRLGYPQRYHRLVSGGPEVYWRVTAFQPK